jgi:hypothetical protein
VVGQQHVVDLDREIVALQSHEGSPRQPGQLPAPQQPALRLSGVGVEQLNHLLAAVGAIVDAEQR